MVTFEELYLIFFSRAGIIEVMKEDKPAVEHLIQDRIADQKKAYMEWYGDFVPGCLCAKDGLVQCKASEKQTIIVALQQSGFPVDIKPD